MIKHEDTYLSEIRTLVRNIFNESSDDYKKWKRKNVTLRGVTELGKENGVGSITLGAGLYSAALGNKEMARKYGQVYFVVNAIPKKPLIVDSVNRWELWLQNLMYSTLNYKNSRDFWKETNIETEVQKLGYDGVIIKGREMVIYNPSDIMYFKSENELIDYYELNIKEKETSNKNNINDNFKKWFSGSKVVDKNNNPLVVYHGSSKKFSKFSLKNAGQPIIWFSSNKNEIEKGESGAQGISHIMDLYASIKNPAGWNEYEKYGLGELKGMGYDGAMLSSSDGHITGFVFDPTQLKSVLNKGEWNLNDKNIFNEELEDGKKKLNRYVYHKANFKLRERIEKNGIQPFRGAQWLEDTSIKGRVVFATNSENKNDWFDSTWDDDVWRIDIKKISNVKWFMDTNFTWDKNNKHIYTRSAIPRDAIELIKKGTGKDLLQ